MRHRPPGLFTVQLAPGRWVWCKPDGTHVARIQKGGKDGKSWAALVIDGLKRLEQRPKESPTVFVQRVVEAVS